LRADAQRNRDLIVTAATAAFADDNLDLPMEDLARLAGVGVGTLYRRFPDRSALLLAVLQSSLQRVLSSAQLAAQQEPQAWDALVRSMDHSAEMRLVLRLSNSMSAEDEIRFSGDSLIEQIRTELRNVIDGLVNAAQRQGSMRPDISTGDVFCLFAVLHRAASSASGETAMSSFQRVRALVLDGLRTTGPTRLPGQPPLLEETFVRRGTVTQLTPANPIGPAR